MPFTISLTSGLVKSDSTSRRTIESFSLAVPDLSKEASGEADFATSTVANVLPFGGVTTASAVFIKTNNDITVRFNGATAVDGGVLLKENGSMVLIGVEVDEILIDNASGNIAHIDYYLGGV